MLRHMLVAISLLGAAGATSAAPLPLSDEQLDTVTGGAIVAVDIERIQNGERGLFVTVTQIDSTTGEVSRRTFGSSFAIPIPDLPTLPTIATSFTITSGRR